MEEEVAIQEVQKMEKVENPEAEPPEAESESDVVLVDQGSWHLIHNNDPDGSEESCEWL